MKKDRDFKGIWIPKHIWLDPDLSPLEKIFVAEIDSLDNDPERGCFASNEYFGEFFRISEGRAANIISDLKRRGYIKQVFFNGRERGLRVHENVKAGFTLDGSRVHENVKSDVTKRGKQVSRKREHNNIVVLTQSNNPNEVSDAVAPGFTDPLRGEEFSVLEDPAPAGKSSPGGGPKKNWAKEMATAFDQTNETKHRAAGMPYMAFNWRIKEPDNFRHLKNLRTLAIAPDFKTKYGREPSDEEMSHAIDAIFDRAWDYFKHIQTDKGGAIHFTPESIYRSYNTLKSFKNGNNGNVKSTRNGAGSKPPQSPFGRGIGLDSSPNAKFGY